MPTKKGELSATRRGNEFQEKIRIYLESLGFAVEVAKRYRKRNGDRAEDFFGCVDHICIHHSKPWVLFVQATCRASDVWIKRRNLMRMKWHKGQKVQVWSEAWQRPDFFRVQTLVSPIQGIWSDGVDFKPILGWWPHQVFPGDL